MDTAYYTTQLQQLYETFVLLEDIKTKGIMEVTKVRLDEYFAATWAMNYATWTYEAKTQCGPCCHPLLCSFHGYCCSCLPCCWGFLTDKISLRRRRLIHDQSDVKTFLRAQEIRARGFTMEQLHEMKDRAFKALESKNMASIMKEAEELDQMDRNLSTLGSASQFAGIPQGMQQMFANFPAGNQMQMAQNMQQMQGFQMNGR